MQRGHDNKKIMPELVSGSGEEQNRIQNQDVKGAGRTINQS
jgi:hypothetical protein